MQSPGLLSPYLCSPTPSNLSVTSSVSPSVAKSRSYIDEKRAKEQARADAHDVAALRSRLEESILKRVTSAGETREKTVTELDTKKMQKLDSLNASRGDLHSSTKATLSSIESSIEEDRVAAKLHAEKKLLRHQAEAAEAPDPLALTHMEKTISNTVMMSDKKALKRLAALKLIVATRRQELGEWKKATRAHEQHLFEQRNEHMRTVVEESKKDLRMRNAEEKAATEFRSGVRVLLHQEEAQRVRIRDVENYDGKCMLAKCQIAFRKAMDATEKEVSTEALRQGVQMKQYALEQKQLVLVDDMLNRERENSKAYEAAKRVQKEKEEQEKAEAVAASAAHRRRCQEVEAEKKRSFLEEQEALRALHGERKAELDTANRRKNVFHKAQCRLGVQEITERVAVVIQEKSDISETSMRTWQAQVEAVREHHEYARDHAKEEHHQIRELKMARHKEKYEEDHGKESAFSAIVMAKEAAAREKHHLLVVEHKRKKDELRERQAAEIVRKALEIKEDTLFAQEICELNRAKEKHIKMEKVRSVRESFFDTHDAVFPFPLRTHNGRSPLGKGKGTDGSDNSIDRMLGDTASRYIAPPAQTMPAMPRRDPYAKSFAYPTPTMMEATDINPVIKEKAERMLELMQELYPAEAKMALSKQKVSSVSPHLTRSGIEKEVLCDDVRLKNEIRTIHTDTKPVSSVNQRLYDSKKMSATPVKSPPPPRPPRPSQQQAEEQFLNRFTNKFYTRQVDNQKERHNMIAKKYEVIPRHRSENDNFTRTIDRLSTHDSEKKAQRSEKSLQKLAMQTKAMSRTLTNEQIKALNVQLFSGAIEQRENEDKKLFANYVHDVVMPVIPKSVLDASVQKLSKPKKHED